MSIPSFSGLISSDLKQLFSNAISSLLEDTALTVSCTLYFGVTKYEDCSNCIYDPIGRKSSNRYQDGGAAPFRFGTVCPICGGQGKKPVITTENLNLAVIYDYRNFLNSQTPVNIPDGSIQTICANSLMPKLLRAKELQTSTDIKNYMDARFERITDPQPVGFGNNDFVFCTWKRIK